MQYLHDSVQHGGVVPETELDLHRRDLRDSAGLLDLADVHVAEADTLDEPVVPERSERTHARRERRPRVGRVKLVQMNTVHAERAQAGFARGAQMPAPSVRYPLALRSSQASFGANHDAGAVAAPGGECPSDESFVMTGLGVVQAVGVGGVEERDAFVERGMQHLDGVCLVTLPAVRLPLGRQPHAAHTDRSRETRLGG